MSTELPTNDDSNASLLAEQHLDAQVKIERRTLDRTRLICMISTFVTLIYIGFITVNLQQYLGPVSAAELTDGVIAQHVEDDGPQIASQVKAQIPVLIGQVPDYVKQQIPVFRQNLEDQLNTSLTSNLNASAQQTGKAVDDYLDTHKDEIHSALKSGQDSAAVKQIGDSVTQQFMTSLAAAPDGGESVQSKIDSSLQALQAIQAKMDRLANGTNLTPQEKQTRHAIAVMTKTISHQVPASPLISVAKS